MDHCLEQKKGQPNGEKKKGREDPPLHFNLCGVSNERA